MKILLGLLWFGCAMPVFAHGDDEHAEHAHAAPSAVLQTNAEVPALSAESRNFELVGRLYPHELGLYLDDWASDAPVLAATVEVELDGRSAVAQFHADHGDYALVDPALLQALQTPGAHALLFTITAGNRADLLTATLNVEAEKALGVAQGPVVLKWSSALALVLLVLFFLMRRLRRGTAHKQQGGSV